MPKYQQPLVSVVVLDFNRPTEAGLLLESLRRRAKFSYETVYVSNGGDQTYVKVLYDTGLIDTLVLNRQNVGCGLGTKQGFKAASGRFVLYVQVDQWLRFDIEQSFLDNMVKALDANPKLLYFDLAGNQGHGQFSERALFIARERYLAIPDLADGYGGPGPYADNLWSEEAVQNYMRREDLTFGSVGALFGDNGKMSVRDYPCGGQILLTTDTKELSILKPVTQRIDFPNLKLTNAEWAMILSDQWVNGTVPEEHKADSFVVWQKVAGVQDLS